jgi:Cu/Ag efflux pump CusA
VELLPLAVGSGHPCREIEGPIAIVILGCLFCSTALNLPVLPTFAWHFGSFSKNTLQQWQRILPHPNGKRTRQARTG